MGLAPRTAAFSPTRRQPQRIVDEGETRSYLADRNKGLPLVIEAHSKAVPLVDWAVDHRTRIEADLIVHGAILFRGFAVDGVRAFQHLISRIAGDPIEYTYASTPRTAIDDRIYTSTEYPADQVIPLHNEMSFATSWPGRIFFHCMKASSSGGETPIADSRRVFERIDPAVRARFCRDGVTYVRNYGSGLDLSWQDVFRTDRRDDVDRFCKAAGIECEWRDDRLRTRQTCQATLRHRRTGQMVWFNQAHLFHVSSLPQETRAALLDILPLEDLPRNAVYGDGQPIEREVLDHIRDVYTAEQVATAWREGDVLMMDNVLAAHGRNAFSGERKIVVGMAQPSGAVAGEGV